MAYALVLQLGLPAAVGVVLGYLLLGKSMNESKTLFGTDPMDDYVAAAVGGVVVGIGGWFALGVILGLNA
jgi:hypothetical protein